jgi:hypothetical protein
VERNGWCGHEPDEDFHTWNAIDTLRDLARAKGRRTQTHEPGDTLMKSFHQLHRRGLCLATIFIIAFTLTGCSIMGPAAIRSGRLAYNEAINETNNQQILMIAIHNRYEESGTLLAVASVTANIRFTTSTGIQMGMGPDEDYSGNLVPFSAGAVYEENPTISYTPVEGENYMRSLMSPVPVATLAQLTTTLADPAPIFTALVSRVNNIHNPDFQHPRIEPDLRFDRFVTIMTELSHAYRLYWIADPEKKNCISIVIEHYAPDYTTEVNELLNLLDLAPPKDTSSAVILPVYLSQGVRDEGGIAILTRSVFDLVEIFSAAIAVPEEDDRYGVAKTYPPASLAGAGLHVSYSEDQPEGAYVAVKQRGGWFYIDEKDQATKSFFRLLGTLWSVAMAECVARSSASPILTIPVSR